MHVVKILLVLLVFPSFLAAQFRGEEPRPPSVSEGMTQQSASLALFGFFRPENLDMRHSFSVSYGMFGDQGVGISMYTNSLRYRIAEPLSVRADISMMFSPFGGASPHFKNDLSGIFLRRASIDYEPSKNMRVSLQYRNIPSVLYTPAAGRSMYSPTLYRGGVFLHDDDLW